MDFFQFLQKSTDDSDITTLNSSEAVKQMIYGAIVLTLAWTYAKISEGA